MGDAREDVGEKSNVVGAQSPVVLEKTMHRLVGRAAVEHATVQYQGLAYEPGCAAMTPTALLLETRRTAGLGEQHGVNGIDLTGGQVVVVQESPQVAVGMVSHQATVDHLEISAGECSGMAVAAAAAVVPHAVQVDTGGGGCGRSDQGEAKCEQ